MNFTCTTCGAEHDLHSISFGSDAPDQWTRLSEEERNRSELGGEQCVIETSDGTHYFIRACLEIPIIGREQPFSWGVWCSLSETSFLEMSQHWHDSGRTSLGPYFGWLCTRVPEYPETMFMKTKLHQRAVGMRPLVELEESNHLLSIHQSQGIREQDMQRIVSRLLHARMPNNALQPTCETHAAERRR